MRYSQFIAPTVLTLAAGVFGAPGATYSFSKRTHSCANPFEPGGCNIDNWPVCKSPCRDFQYQGCYPNQVNSPNTVNLLAHDAGILPEYITRKNCWLACKGRGFRLAGITITKFQKRTHPGDIVTSCRCGNYPLEEIEKVDDSKCNYKCTAINAPQEPNCGGQGYISIYKDTTFPEVTPELVENAVQNPVHLGCNKENDRRLLLDEQFLTPMRPVNTGIDSLTTDMCLEACASKGYSYSGVTGGWQCFCGGIMQPGLDRQDSASLSSKCNSKCSGDPKQMCGGPAVSRPGADQFGYLHVYRLPGFESSEPCGAPVKPDVTKPPKTTKITKTTKPTKPPKTTAAPEEPEEPVDSEMPEESDNGVGTICVMPEPSSGDGATYKGIQWPLGGLNPPSVSCHNDKVKFKAGYHFKLYVSDGSDCRIDYLHKTTEIQAACWNACIEQSKICKSKYASKEIKKNGVTWTKSVLTQQCESQLKACKDVNKATASVIITANKDYCQNYGENPSRPDSSGGYYRF